MGNWIKVLLSTVLPTRARPSYSHHQSPSYQETYTRHLASTTRGQTEEARRTTISHRLEPKPHQQKVNQDEKAEGFIPDEGTE